MQNWKKTISVATLCVTMLGPLPVGAMEQPLPVLAPVGEEATSAPQELSIVGDLLWVDLEGGFYSVDGYRLIGDDEAFKELLGQRVKVVGTIFDGFSIQMVRAINVQEIAPHNGLKIAGELVWMDLEGGFYSVDGYRLIGNDEEFKMLLGQQVRVSGTIFDGVSIQMVKAINVEEIAANDQKAVHTLTGLLTWTDLEGGFYSVDGYRLIGDEELIKPFADQEVLVTGTIYEGISIYMTKALNMETIGPLVTIDKPELPRDEQPGPRGKMVGATRRQPATVTIDGCDVRFDSKLLVNGGTLLLPLRPIVEAAGGTIEWSQKTRTATVTLRDRMACFVANEKEAEMNEHNARYLRRNMIAMDRAPKTIAGRMYVSADALSNILGLLETGTEGDVLNLITPIGLSEQVNPVQEPVKYDTITGTIKEIKEEGRFRILLEGGAMTNGEAYLIWLSVDDSSKLMWAETDQIATVADLKVGHELTVELSGPVMESYPAQGGAASIIIVR